MSIQLQVLHRDAILHAAVDMLLHAWLSITVTAPTITEAAGLLISCSVHTYARVLYVQYQAEGRHLGQPRVLAAVCVQFMHGL
jgi:hypothetical protein